MYLFNKQKLSLWTHRPILALLAVFRTAFKSSYVTHSLNRTQVIKARFGARTHLVFCTFAFFTNLIVMMSLTVAGTAVLNRYVLAISAMIMVQLCPSLMGCSKVGNTRAEQ